MVIIYKSFFNNKRHFCRQKECNYIFRLSNFAVLPVTYNRNSSFFQNFLYIFRVNIGVLIFIQIVCVSFPLSAYHANKFPTKKSVEQYVGRWQTKSPSEPVYQRERWKGSEKEAFSRVRFCWPLPQGNTSIFGELGWGWGIDTRAR